MKIKLMDLIYIKNYLLYFFEQKLLNFLKKIIYCIYIFFFWQNIYDWVLQKTVIILS